MVVTICRISTHYIHRRTGPAAPISTTECAVGRIFLLIDPFRIPSALGVQMWKTSRRLLLICSKVFENAIRTQLSHRFIGLAALMRVGREEKTFRALREAPWHWLINMKQQGTGARDDARYNPSTSVGVRIQKKKEYISCIVQTNRTRL